MLGETRAFQRRKETLRDRGIVRIAVCASRDKRPKRYGDNLDDYSDLPVYCRLRVHVQFGFRRCGSLLPEERFLLTFAAR